MNFVAFERAKQGTGASRRLRNSGRTPGIVYGGTAEPQAIELDHNALWYALKKEAFHSSVLSMELNGQATQVVLRDVQYHPYKQMVQHIDFQRVDATTKLHKKVPVHYSGAEESAAVKIDKCMVTPIVTELDVSCMPSDLPEFIAVDLSGLTKSSSLRVKDVVLPKSVKAVAKGQVNPVMVSVTPIVEEVEAAPVVAVDPKAKPGAKGGKPAAKPAAKK